MVSASGRRAMTCVQISGGRRGAGAAISARGAAAHGDRGAYARRAGAGASAAAGRGRYGRRDAGFSDTIFAVLLYAAVTRNIVRYRTVLYGAAGHGGG